MTKPNYPSNYILSFAQDLLIELKQLLESCGEDALREHRMNTIRPNAEKIVEKLMSYWGNKLDLHVVLHPEAGKNILLHGVTGSYYIPYLTWHADVSFSRFINKFQQWLENLPESINWTEFQSELSVLLFLDKQSNKAISKQHLEIIRFYASIFIDWGYYTKEKTTHQLKQLFRLYVPNYDIGLTQNKLIKYYSSIAERYTNEYPIPLPIPWQLDCLLLTPESISLNKSNIWPSFPIWVVPHIQNRDPLFVMHRIPAKSVNRRNPLYNNLVNKIYLFWNLNHFIPQFKNKNNSRLIWGIPSIFTIYNKYEHQDNILINTFIDKSNILEKRNSISDNSILFNPTWTLTLEFPSYTLKNSTSTYLDDYHNLWQYVKENSIIRTYNLSYLYNPKSFIEKFNQVSTKNPIDLLFGRRLYLIKMPPTIKVLILIEARNKTQKRHLEKLIPLIMAWLPKGPLIHYKRGILISTMLPKQILNSFSEFVKDTTEFFNIFDLEITCLLEKNDFVNSAINFYYLPESNQFNYLSNEWKLSDNKLIMSLEEQKLFIENVLKVEKNNKM